MIFVCGTKVLRNSQKFNLFIPTLKPALPSGRGAN